MKDKEFHHKGAVERIFRERNQSEPCLKTIPQFVRIANAIISVQYIIGLNFGENGDAVITLGGINESVPVKGITPEQRAHLEKTLLG